MQEELKNNEPVPFYIYEEIMARDERNIRRLIIALIMTILLLFISNGTWLYAWFQYDYMTEESVTVDGKDGIANYIGKDGDIVNGEDSRAKAEDPAQKE